MVQYNTAHNTVSPVHLGLDGFVWWLGVVEDRKDPLHLGRARVRVHGWHTEDKSLIPTENLPWAHVLHPVNGTHGNVVPPKEGTVVLGYFMDGKEGEFPVILGIFNGIPEEVGDAGKGFTDPGKDLESRPGAGVRYPDRLNEPHTPRLARNEDVGGANTYIEARKTNAVSVKNASGEEWKEPTDQYKTVYPYSDVRVTESGHTFEIDDTKGAERINTVHRTGTYEELQADGSRAVHVIGNDYHVVVKNNNVYVKGNLNINVDGNANILVGGDVIADIKGGVRATIGKDVDVKIGGKLKIDNGGTFSHKSGGNMRWEGPRYDFKE